MDQEFGGLCPVQSADNWTLEKAAKAIEANIQDNREIIEREKQRVYNIKADVRTREIQLQVYEQCLRIVRGEQKY